MLHVGIALLKYYRMAFTAFQKHVSY